MKILVSLMLEELKAKAAAAEAEALELVELAAWAAEVEAWAPEVRAASIHKAARAAEAKALRAAAEVEAWAVRVAAVKAGSE